MSVHTDPKMSTSSCLLYVTCVVHGWALIKSAGAYLGLIDGG